MKSIERLFQSARNLVQRLAPGGRRRRQVLPAVIHPPRDPRARQLER